MFVPAWLVLTPTEGVHHLWVCLTFDSRPTQMGLCKCGCVSSWLKFVLKGPCICMQLTQVVLSQALSFQVTLHVGPTGEMGNIDRKMLRLAPKPHVSRVGQNIHVFRHSFCTSDRRQEILGSVSANLCGHSRRGPKCPTSKTAGKQPKRVPSGSQQNIRTETPEKQLF